MYLKLTLHVNKMILMQNEDSQNGFRRIQYNEYLTSQSDI